MTVLMACLALAAMDIWLSPVLKVVDGRLVHKAVIRRQQILAIQRRRHKGACTQVTMHAFFCVLHSPLLLQNCQAFMHASLKAG